MMARKVTSTTLAIVFSVALCVNSLTLNANLEETTKERATTTSLRSDLSFLASDGLEGRSTGSQGNARARQFLIAKLTEMGAIPLLDGSFDQSFDLPSVRTSATRQASDQEGSTANSPRLGHNVVALFPSHGAANRENRLSPTIVVTAHYDHLGKRGDVIFNGADDNASGVAALLEIGRRLSGLQTHNDVVLAFLDAEEIGLLGARALVAKLSDDTNRPLLLNINLDMVGRSDGGSIFVAGLAHSPALRPTMEIIAKTSNVALEFGHDTGLGSDNWTLASDHGAFHRAGVPFLYFGVEDHADYHRPTDDSDRIDYQFLNHVTLTVMATVIAFDQELVFTAPSDSRN